LHGRLVVLCSVLRQSPAARLLRSFLPWSTSPALDGETTMPHSSHSLQKIGMASPLDRISHGAARWGREAYNSRPVARLLSIPGTCMPHMGHSRLTSGLFSTSSWFTSHPFSGSS